MTILDDWEAVSGLFFFLSTLHIVCRGGGGIIDGLIEKWGADGMDGDLRAFPRDTRHTSLFFSLVPKMGAIRGRHTQYVQYI